MQFWQLCVTLNKFLSKTQVV